MACKQTNNINFKWISIDEKAVKEIFPFLALHFEFLSPSQKKVPNIQSPFIFSSEFISIFINLER